MQYNRENFPKLYQVWASMKHRTTNQNHKQFKDWGGKGISVCNEWKDNFAGFCEWSMKNGYQNCLSIDRINNDGNYEPLNCRWVDKTTQNRNTRKLISRNKSGYRGVCFFL